MRFACLFGSWLLALPCFGQAYTYRDPSFMGWAARPLTGGAATPDYSGYPTNQSGYPVYGWWPVNGNYGSNAANGMWTLTNQSIEVVAAGLIDLTNSPSTNDPVLMSSALNSKDALNFDGNGDYMKAANFSTSQPFDVCMVLNVTNASPNAYIFADVNNSVLYLKVVSAGVVLGQSSTTTFNNIPANKWIVLHGLINGTNSSFYTNNITLSPATGGATNVVTMSGLTLGARFNLTATFPGYIAEMIVWRTNLTASVRSNIFSYLTNKYAISL